jgi:glycosyltransferase involved in cell wall biosynthesis
MKKISVVVPVFNEEKNIAILCDELFKIIELYRDTYEFEILLVNDGSCDNSWQTIQELSRAYVCIKGIDLSANFGHQIALSAGYDFADGDAIITMDADMQHPPYMIPAMIDKWLEGFAIVYVKSLIRNDRFFKKFTAILYYKILQTITPIEMPRNVADFRLIDKKVANALRSSQEKRRYLRGMVAWTGFKYTILSCQFSERLSGTSGYTWKKMFTLALDGLIGFSGFPFSKIAAFLQVFLLVNGLLFSFFCFDHFFNIKIVPLWPLSIVLFSILIGAQFLVMSYVAYILSVICDHAKNRPQYLVAKLLNLEE